MRMLRVLFFSCVVLMLEFAIASTTSSTLSTTVSTVTVTSESCDDVICNAGSTCHMINNIVPMCIPLDSKICTHDNQCPEGLCVRDSWYFPGGPSWVLGPDSHCQPYRDCRLTGCPHKPNAICSADESGKYECRIPKAPTCSDISCGAGWFCRISNNVPTCFPGAGSCNQTGCDPGQTCVRSGNNFSCQTQSFLTSDCNGKCDLETQICKKNQDNQTYSCQPKPPPCTEETAPVVDPGEPEARCANPDLTCYDSNGTPRYTVKDGGEHWKKSETEFEFDAEKCEKKPVYKCENETTQVADVFNTSSSGSGENGGGDESSGSGNLNCKPTNFKSPTTTGTSHGPNKTINELPENIDEPYRDPCPGGFTTCSCDDGQTQICSEVSGGCGSFEGNNGQACKQIAGPESIVDDSEAGAFVPPEKIRKKYKYFFNLIEKAFAQVVRTKKISTYVVNKTLTNAEKASLNQIQQILGSNIFYSEVLIYDKAYGSRVLLKSQPGIDESVWQKESALLESNISVEPNLNAVSLLNKKFGLLKLHQNHSFHLGRVTQNQVRNIKYDYINRSTADQTIRVVGQSLVSIEVFDQDGLSIGKQSGPNLQWPLKRFSKGHLLISIKPTKVGLYSDVVMVKVADKFSANLFISGEVLSDKLLSQTILANANKQIFNQEELNIDINQINAAGLKIQANVLIRKKDSYIMYVNVNSLNSRLKLYGYTNAQVMLNKKENISDRVLKARPHYLEIIYAPVSQQNFRRPASDVNWSEVIEVKLRNTKLNTIEIFKIKVNYRR